MVTWIIFIVVGVVFIAVAHQLSKLPPKEDEYGLKNISKSELDEYDLKYGQHFNPTEKYIRSVALDVKEIKHQNARAGLSSIEHSVSSDVIDFVSAIRSEVERSDTSASEKKSASEVIDAVEAQIKSGKPSKVVVSTLLGSLPRIASVETLVAALLPLVGK